MKLSRSDHQQVVSQYFDVRKIYRNIKVGFNTYGYGYCLVIYGVLDSYSNLMFPKTVIVDTSLMIKL